MDEWYTHQDFPAQLAEHDVTSWQQARRRQYIGMLLIVVGSVLLCLHVSGQVGALPSPGAWAVGVAAELKHFNEDHLALSVSVTACGMLVTTLLGGHDSTMMSSEVGTLDEAPRAAAPVHAFERSAWWQVSLNVVYVLVAGPRGLVFLLLLLIGLALDLPRLAIRMLLAACFGLLITAARGSLGVAVRAALPVGRRDRDPRLGRPNLVAAGHLARNSRGAGGCGGVCRHYPSTRRVAACSSQHARYT